LWVTKGSEPWLEAEAAATGEYEGKELLASRIR
jgi:hypothetical protein